MHMNTFKTMVQEKERGDLEIIITILLGTNHVQNWKLYYRFFSDIKSETIEISYTWYLYISYI